MKIIGGVDKEFTGERWARPDLKVGFLEQEPSLDPSKDVFG